MKIAWFTPYNFNSAIAKYSQAVITALNQHFEVTLFLPESDRFQENLPLPERVAYYNPENLASMLDDYDFSVFNMGDSGFHIGVWQALQLTRAALLPIVCIQHDWVCFDFFWVLLVAPTESNEALFNLIEKYYGPTALSKYMAWKNDGVEDIRLSLPLFEPVTALADAVIVHSEYCANKISAGYPGNIKKLFLPVSMTSVNDLELALLSKKQLGLPENSVILLSLGFCTTIKQADKTIQALGKLKQKNPKLDFVFCIVGDQEPGFKKKLDQLILQYKLENQVVFHGYASPEEKHSYLHHADFCINLRNPCFEGASAALIEALSYGKTCVVSNHGSYAEFSDELVVKINPGDEVKELVAILPKLLSEENVRKQMGAKAQQYALKYHSDAQYVEEFSEFVESLLPKFQQLQAVRKVAIHFRAELANIKLPGENFLSQAIVRELLSFVPGEHHEFVG